MRRVFYKLIALTISGLLLIPTIAFADQHCDVYQANMEVDLPNDLLFFMRNVNDNDTAIKYLPYTKDELLDIMRERDIYLLGYTDEYEFQIMMSSSPIDYLSNLSASEYSDFISAVEARYDNLGITLFSTDTFTCNGVKYLVTSIRRSADGISQYSLNYTTVVDRKMMIFSIGSYSGNVTDEERNVIKDIVNNTKYDALKKEPPSDDSGSEKKEDATSYIVYIIAGCCAGIILIALAIVFLKKSKTKERNPDGQVYDSKAGITRCQVGGSTDTTALSSLENQLPAKENQIESGDNSQDNTLERKRYCRYCGKLIPVDSSFCSFCGRPLSEP